MTFGRTYPATAKRHRRAVKGRFLPTRTSPCYGTVLLSLWTKQPVRSTDGLREKPEQSGRNYPG